MKHHRKTWHRQHVAWYSSFRFWPSMVALSTKTCQAPWSTFHENSSTRLLHLSVVLASSCKLCMSFQAGTLTSVWLDPPWEKHLSHQLFQAQLNCDHLCFHTLVAHPKLWDTTLVKGSEWKLKLLGCTCHHVSPKTKILWPPSVSVWATYGIRCHPHWWSLSPASHRRTSLWDVPPVSSFENQPLPAHSCCKVGSAQLCLPACQSMLQVLLDVCPKGCLTTIPLAPLQLKSHPHHTMDLRLHGRQVLDQPHSHPLYEKPHLKFSLFWSLMNVRSWCAEVASSLQSPHAASLIHVHLVLLVEWLVRGVTGAASPGSGGVSGTPNGTVNTSEPDAICCDWSTWPSS